MSWALITHVHGAALTTSASTSLREGSATAPLTCRRIAVQARSLSTVNAARCRLHKVGQLPTHHVMMHWLSSSIAALTAARAGRPAAPGRRLRPPPWRVQQPSAAVDAQQPDRVCVSARREVQGAGSRGGRWPWAAAERQSGRCNDLYTPPASDRWPPRPVWRGEEAQGNGARSIASFAAAELACGASRGAGESRHRSPVAADAAPASRRRRLLRRLPCAAGKQPGLLPLRRALAP